MSCNKSNTADTYNSMNENYLARVTDFCSSLFSRKDKKLQERLKNFFGKVKEDTFDFEYIEDYFKNKDHSKAHQVLSEKMCADLNLDELFMFIDRTHSKVGQQYLYNALREIYHDKNQHHSNGKVVDQLYRNKELRLKLTHAISGKPPDLFGVVNTAMCINFLNLVKYSLMDTKKNESKKTNNTSGIIIGNQPPALNKKASSMIFCKSVSILSILLS